MIGASTEAVVAFAQRVLARALPPSFQWRKSDRQMRDKTTWGYRAVFIWVGTHGSPSAVTYSPRIRHDAVEDFFNQHRVWGGAPATARQIEAFKKKSLTWSLFSAAPTGEQDAVDLPAEEAWLEARLTRLAELALARLQPNSDLEVLLDEIKGHDIEHELAIYAVLNRKQEGRARCAELLMDITIQQNAELLEYVQRCQPLFEY